MLKFKHTQSHTYIQRQLTPVAMVLVVIMLLLLAYFSDGGIALPAQSLHAQPSPPVSKGASQQGTSQENRMRLKLREEGFDQPLGEADVTIRQNLGLKANAGLSH